MWPITLAGRLSAADVSFSSPPFGSCPPLRHPFLDKYVFHSFLDHPLRLDVCPFHPI